MQRARSTRPTSLSMQVMLWFAAHADEELTTHDIVLKFGVNKKTASLRLDCAMNSGYLERKWVAVPVNGGRIGVYYPGPRLLECINR